MDLLFAPTQLEALATNNKRCPHLFLSRFVLGRLPTCANQRPTGRIRRIISAGSLKTALGDVACGEGRVKLGGFANGEETSKDSKGWFFEIHLPYRINILVHTKKFSAYTSCFGLKVWSHVLWFVVGKGFDEASFRAPFSGSRNKLQTSFHVKSSRPTTRGSLEWSTWILQFGHKDFIKKDLRISKSRRKYNFITFS